MIEKVGDKTYKISFKEKQDHERVLQKKFHTISLLSGELHLTVNRTNSPQTPKHFDQPSISHSQTFKKENTNGLEKIFKTDVFFLYYLRDNPKAFKVLENQLSTISCKVELDFDREEAVVRGDVENGPGGAFGSAAETWELQVDKIFVGFTESCLCYHVVEPKLVKILLQDLSFVTDNIKVYTEDGYAVVVGEVQAVKERIAILEARLPTRKELPVVEKQFKLVEEEFSRKMCAHCLEVKILRGNVNLIILEGPDKEVQLGVTKLEELMKKIKEKRVKLSTALMNFMTSSGVISKYQTHFQHSLRNPVALEVGSDLLLSSLSSDALDEAETAVLRELSEVTVQLQGAAALPPDLDKVKEVLIKAKNEANLRERRVDVSFISVTSGAAVTKVQLVGYSETVNKLREVLQDYQMNHVSTQEVLNIPNPDMIDSFDKILGLIGMKPTEVTLKASHFLYPCVLVSGPRCLVQEAKWTLISTLASLTSDTLVLDGPGAQHYFQREGKVSKELVESSCHVLITAQQGVQSRNVNTTSQSISNPGPSSVTPQPLNVGSMVVNKINLEIKFGNLEDEQVDVLVVPMLNKKLTVTKIGECLLNKVGNTIKSKFELVAANCTLRPGDVLQVDGPPSLSCSKIFFIECLPWDGVRGQSVQALGNGLKRCLDLCVQQGLSSVAFPIIGPGIILNYPLIKAIQTLTENIRQFGLSASSGSLTTIRIVIKPDYPDSECYHDVYWQLSLSMNQGGQAIFRSLISDLDEITITVGDGVKLQLVFDDITSEITYPVVNTTDFSNYGDAKVNRGDILVSHPGSFPCDAILHVCGEKDAGLIEQLVCRIIYHCESIGFESMTIPAIDAGVGGLDPGVVAGAILRGVKAATSSTLYRLTKIRLVLIKINVFLAFKEEAMQMFATAVINRAPVHQFSQAPQQQLPLSMNTDLSIVRTISTSQQSIFRFLGLSRKDVNDAMIKLNNLYEAQCSTQTLKKAELEGLTQDDMNDLTQLVETLGLYMQMNQGDLMVSGWKDGVGQVTQMINAFQHDCLRREVRVKEEEDLYGRVAWCILGHNGNWERLPKTANHDLEVNYVAGGIVDAQGIHWTVDQRRIEAKIPYSGQAAKLKRLESWPDFTPPLYWDNMANDENLMVVALQPSSAEYQTVKEAFKRTVPKTVMKIERLQNVHLRRAYEVQKKHISDKNGQTHGAGEKLLYHGTTQDNCDSIMKTGFNRSFANVTAYGLGTYFAVHASYSAHPTYSKPAMDDTQLMFVARVLTGIYTQGRSDMKVPPPLSDQQPHERYDSVVDKMDNPNMYVVFHDHQAYPDYLITFK
ncbi:protein mono-ADP-ribosyltransferase PARP14-like [Scomber scombrus]|uniref:Poly [ADP-ribose] polymerase n=1 Tax=Scomber scombrus TaxID=13677 RepID=A0AAV1Q8B5_SCOSC